MEMMPEQEQTQEGVPSYTSGQEGQEEMDPQMKQKVERGVRGIGDLAHLPRPGDRRKRIMVAVPRGGEAPQMEVR